MRAIETDRLCADCGIQDESTVYYRVNLPGGVKVFYSCISTKPEQIIVTIIVIDSICNRPNSEKFKILSSNP